MKIKTSELIDKPLDWAVTLAIGEYRPVAVPDYSTNWSQGGPIIERERITWTGQSARICTYSKGVYQNFEEFGPTPLIAAMRCFVASKLGDEVDVPDELTKE